MFSVVFVWMKRWLPKVSWFLLFMSLSFGIQFYKILNGFDYTMFVMKFISNMTKIWHVFVVLLLSQEFWFYTSNAQLALITFKQCFIKCQHLMRNIEPKYFSFQYCVWKKSLHVTFTLISKLWPNVFGKVLCLTTIISY